MKCFLTQDHMELEISKRYFSNNFQQIPSKPYGDIAYDTGMQDITLCCNRLNFTKFMALWNCQMGK